MTPIIEDRLVTQFLRCVTSHFDLDDPEYGKIRIWFHLNERDSGSREANQYELLDHTITLFGKPKLHTLTFDLMVVPARRRTPEEVTYLNGVPKKWIKLDDHNPYRRTFRSLEAVEAIGIPTACAWVKNPWPFRTEVTRKIILEMIQALRKPAVQPVYTI